MKETEKTFKFLLSSTNNSNNSGNSGSNNESDGSNSMNNLENEIDINNLQIKGAFMLNVCHFFIFYCFYENKFDKHTLVWYHNSTETYSGMLAMKTNYLKEFFKNGNSK